MKIFFVYRELSDLADEKSTILNATRDAMIANCAVEEAKSMDSADAIIIQEKNSFKDFRYIHKLLTDPLVSKYTHKVFTINTDDCATGLLRGLYTSIPKHRFDSRLHTSVPFMEYPNEMVFSKPTIKTPPALLASWRGNIKSNKIRLKMIAALQDIPEYHLEKTDSWLNHNPDEKMTYINLMQNTKFSLCPAGWAPVSFRIYESMALGRCPVIIADKFVPPIGPDWSSFALFFPEKEIYNLHSFLHRHEEQYEKLGNKAYNAWNSFFESSHINKYYASSLISLIMRTPRCSRESEIKRWKSLHLFWSNKWTVPQRILNRARKLAEQ